MRWSMFTLLVGALAAPIAAGPALAYPERPVRFIIGFGAGGTGDIVARLVAQELSAALGRPVPVENRTGAGGNVAFEAAAKAEPDGHTVMLASPAFAVDPPLYGDRLRWKQEDLAPVILLGFTPVAVIVRPEFPARDVRDLVGSARSRGGGALLAGISGSGTSSHLANILFQAAALRRPWSWWPVRAKMLELGVDPAGSTPEELADLIRRETARWARVVAETGARVE